MTLDYQKIHHNYIIRLVILAVFLFKNERKNKEQYKNSIIGYINKRLGYNAIISVDIGPKLTIDDQRDRQIDSILEDTNELPLNLIVVHFKTSHKVMNLQIDLSDEDKYETYLYS